MKLCVDEVVAHGFPCEVPHLASHVQAKRNLESSKVFQAHEAAAAAQAALADRQATIQEAMDALASERAERGAIAASKAAVERERDALACQVQDLQVCMQPRFQVFSKRVFIAQPHCNHLYIVNHAGPAC